MCKAHPSALSVRSSESGEVQTLGKGPQNSLGKKKFIKNSERNLFVLFYERHGQNPEMNRTLGEENWAKKLARKGTKDQYLPSMVPEWGPGGNKTHKREIAIQNGCKLQKIPRIWTMPYKIKFHWDKQTPGEMGEEPRNWEKRKFRV